MTDRDMQLGPPPPEGSTDFLTELAEREQVIESSFCAPAPAFPFHPTVHDPDSQWSDFAAWAD